MFQWLLLLRNSIISSLSKTISFDNNLSNNISTKSYLFLKLISEARTVIIKEKSAFCKQILTFIVSKP